MQVTSLVVGVLLGASLFACRGDSPKTGEPPPDTGPGGIHIQDIQSDSMPVNTAVELHGVIVTAMDSFGARTAQDIWVQEPGGGPRSGVHVFRVSATQVAMLAVGDIVDITGAIKSEFALAADKTGKTVTQIQPPQGGAMTITKTGTGTVPAPAVLDALEIGLKPEAERNAEWEKWEGVLITVKNVAAQGQPSCITSQGVCTDSSNQKFTVTGDLSVQSALAAMPVAGSIAGDVCLASVTGVVDYFFDYLLYPRTTAEIVAGGTACPAHETAAQCNDHIDNDANGFIDCDDNACAVALATCRGAATITSIQAATPTTPVGIENVFVTAVAANKKSFWIATNLTAARNEGVFVFRSNNAPDLDATIVPGAKVDVIGRVTEFNDDEMAGTLTQLRALDVKQVLAPGGPLVPSMQTAAALLVPATAATFESVLVTLSDVNITDLGTEANGFVATAVQEGTTFKLGSDVVKLTTDQLGCYKTITGLWTNLQASGSAATMKPNAFGLIPLTPLPEDKGTGDCR